MTKIILTTVLCSVSLVFCQAQIFSENDIDSISNLLNRLSIHNGDVKNQDIQNLIKASETNSSYLKNSYLKDIKNEDIQNIIKASETSSSYLRDSYLKDIKNEDIKNLIKAYQAKNEDIDWKSLIIIATMTEE